MFLDKFTDIERINKPCKPFHKSLLTLLLESKFDIIKTNTYLTKLQFSNNISNFVTIHTYRFPRFILLDSNIVYPSLKSTNSKHFFSSFYWFLSPSTSCAQQLLWRLLSSIRTAQSYANRTARRTTNVQFLLWAHIVTLTLAGSLSSHPSSGQQWAHSLDRKTTEAWKCHSPRISRDYESMVFTGPPSLMAATSPCSFKDGKNHGPYIRKHYYYYYCCYYLKNV